MDRVREGYVPVMSRTQVRVVLILVAFILVVAAILSGILTYWVGAQDLPAPTPEPGETGRIPVRSWRPTVWIFARYGAPSPLAERALN